MDVAGIKAALAHIASEPASALKNLKLASLVSEVFRQRHVELVVVGGSALELLTDGAYAGGDLDLCLVKPAVLSPRLRRELMGALEARGGSRHWQVAGLAVDWLGPVESFSRTPFREMAGPYGLVRVMKPEELLVERVLLAHHPQPDAAAAAGAQALATVALRGQLDLDWSEVRRLAGLPEYRVVGECEALVEQVVRPLQARHPFQAK